MWRTVGAAAHTLHTLRLRNLCLLAAVVVVLRPCLTAPSSAASVRHRRSRFLVWFTRLESCHRGLALLHHDCGKPGQDRGTAAMRPARSEARRLGCPWLWDWGSPKRFASGRATWHARQPRCRRSLARAPPWHTCQDAGGRDCLRRSINSRGALWVMPWVQSGRKWSGQRLMAAWEGLLQPCCNGMVCAALA